MSENRTEVLTGAAVLAAAIGFLVWAAQGTEFGMRQDQYPLRASFRSAEGIMVGTDVRLAGVKIGSVTGLELNPQTFFADTTIMLREDVILPDDTLVMVSSEGLMGGAFLELVPGGSLDNLAAGDEILDTQSAVSVLSLMMKFAGGGSEETVE